MSLGIIFTRDKLLGPMVRQNHRWALSYHDTFMPVLLVKVSLHAGTSKYRDKSTGASSTRFLQILHLQYCRHGILFYTKYNDTVIICKKTSG